MIRKLTSKSLDTLEGACRAVVQPKPVKLIGGGEIAPRKVMGDPGKGHRADQEAFRRLQPIREKAEAIVRKDGGSMDVVAAQFALLAKAKRETTDNIGRAV